MSGALATFLGQANAVGSIVNALTGGGTVLTLGSVSLQFWEVPAKITFGGAQRLTIHKLPGGARVIDAMGPDDIALQWNGIFQGASALSRAQQLNTMRVGGQQQTLTWGGLSFVVVISSFECDYEKSYWMPYRIACEIQAVAQGQAAATPSLLSSVTSDISSATGIDISATYGAVTQGLAQAQQLAAPLTALVGGSSAAASLLGNLTGVANQVQTGITAAGSLLTSVVPTVTNLPSLAGAAGDLAGLSAIGGFVQRAAANVAAA